MFSKTCEYAIRAMIFIAHASRNGEKMSIPEIAAGIGSPLHFIAKILQDLSRKGLVQSLKGPTGGFFLDQTGLSCTLADIVVAIDGDKILLGCALGLKECSESQPCPLHHQFKAIRASICQTLKAARLGDLQEQLDLQTLYLKH
jgi:Rrf2 family protein